MAVDYSQSLVYLTFDNPIENHHYLKPLPDNCPVCRYSISPEFIFIYHKNGVTTELLCGCPRNNCGSLFFAEYVEENNEIFLSNYYPYSRSKKEFTEEIKDLSPDFISIYNQAVHAEQEKLDLICGVGYRKALEFLIKDYALYLSPTDINKIQKMPIQQCVQKYITESDIKAMAERAVWLGNDETHYVRKWENKDITDLKVLIELTVHFLTMKIKAEQYKREMV
ncbi:hypothetical protein [Fictibacillus phosphorivorans]|uniref:hypothetical protein n=1 Tax=Fictibacillus phosphorivorans TaxID=1221500 RepID=UPI0035EC8F3A